MPSSHGLPPVSIGTLHIILAFPALHLNSMLNRKSNVHPCAPETLVEPRHCDGVPGRIRTSDNLLRRQPRKGDRFEVSVTTPPGQPVTVTVKSPHSGRKTFGAADTTHDVRFEAIDDGTYVLIIAADWPRRVLPGESDGNACARLKGQIQYEYTVSRPNSK